MVDLPSLGSEEVTPIILFNFDPPLRFAAIFIARTDSANCESGDLEHADKWSQSAK